MPESPLKERIWGRFRFAFEQYIAGMVDSAMAAGEIRSDLGRDFVMGILGFVLMKFTDIYPNYRELLLQDDAVMLQEMHRLIEFLKYGLCGPAIKEEK